MNWAAKRLRRRQAIKVAAGYILVAILGTLFIWCLMVVIMQLDIILGITP